MKNQKETHKRGTKRHLQRPDAFVQVRAAEYLHPVSGQKRIGKLQAAQL